MPDPEVENRSEFYPKQKDKFLLPACVEERDDTLMDFDLDQDSSWPLYQFTSLISNPTSPILICASDQPCTPLWASIDGDNDENSKLPDQANSVPSTSNSCLNRESRIHQSHLFVPKPIDSPDGYCLMKERMTQALRFFKESTEQHILAQVWAPVKTGGQYVLTTSGQPFVLDPQSIGLHQYRMVSLMYVFSLDSEKDEVLGLPGRVFRQKLPEWTPNVQYYSSREYPRLTHALHYNVQGSLALPIFESSGQTCVGVIELITTAPKINYAPEVEIICKALEAVNLKSSEILDHPNIQICNEGRQNALGEILEVLSAVCEMHKLPLAQTWVPCKHRSVLAYNGGFRKSCTSFDGSCNGKVCMSTTDVAFYVIDAHMWGFRGACLEHHLQKGQGVSGRAFLSQSLSFCSDITRFCKKEYPLAHYALMFGLKSCFAICLKSSFTGDDEYVLEFFLPSSIVEDIEQKIFLGSLLGTMKQHFRTLKVASGIEFEEDKVFVEIIQGSANDGLDFRFECIQIPQSIELPPESTDLVQKAADLVLDAGDSFEKWVLNDGSKPIHEGEIQNPVPFPPQIRDTNKKPVERKRGKTEKSINLEVLQQYFAGSLKDAARSLGVCPTTMKRICRQHGISRWPSRKINKVNRSLSKLKRVIESVQVAEGTFGLNSLTKNTNPSNAKNGSEPEAQIENKESPASTTPQNEVQVEMEDHHDLPREGGPSSSSPEEPIHEQNSKTGSGSREEEGSALAPTSNGSCQGSPTYEMPRAVIPDNILLTGKNDEPFRGMLVEEPFGGMLVEDSGSSKDLKNLCPPGGMDSILDEQVLTNNHSTMDVLPQTMSTLVGGGDMGRFTIKATYKEDMIIRFRIPSGSGIMDLKEEVAKRLKLEVDTFDIKYIDDDNEWVLIACDADLQECVEISKSSGSNIIRLLVNDIIPSLGSSGESSWQ